ncbi:MAG: hypothetical protein IT376_02140 [Polyangiaceae bacterium]|nr:hypothetical protein [Polyangiaceae bacterium]
MEDHVHLALRWPRPLDLEDADPGLLLGRLVARARAEGGVLAGWSERHAAFVHPASSEREVALLAVDLVRDLRAFGARAAISRGELHLVVLVGEAAAAWGPAVSRARALVGVAREGEVVVDPRIEAVRTGALLTRGRRFALLGGQRVRGAVLDAECPVRADLEETVARLAPLLEAAPVEVAAVGVEPGVLTVVRAAPGAGVSGLLGALAERAPGAALRVEPAASGEPLGALRRAFARAAVPAVTGGANVAALEALLAGEGIDAEAAQALLADAMAAPGSRVLVEDAAHVDGDTLEAVAAVAVAGPVAVVATLAPEDTLPRPLAALRPGPEGALGPLAPGAVAAWLERLPLSPRARARVEAAADGTPGALREALAEALESGALRWRSARLVAARSSRPIAAASAAAIALRRLRALPSGDRATLEALAVLGGSATRGELARVLELADAGRADGAGAGELAAALRSLRGRGVLVEEGGVVTIAHRTHRVMAVVTIALDRLGALHLAVSRVRAESASSLESASATVHAFLGGDPREAVRLARRAVASAIAAGLGETADAFEDFMTGGAAALEERGLVGAWDTAGIAWTGAPPTELPPVRPSVRSSPSLGVQLEETRAALASTLAIDTGAAGAVEAPRDGASALRDADADSLERMAERLQVDNVVAADRLRVLAALGRGQPQEAVRLARGASDRARGRSPAERSRAALVLGMALGGAGRSAEALLEVLDALARAREAGDLGGEVACTRFLARLARAAGHPAAASAWEASGRD